jgi:NAD(P)-dependent dehydrogenase (short-subunit alcohol dehydrogenase family)
MTHVNPMPGPDPEHRRARFAGQVAYVTGGASGIGRALVEALRREGALVEVADIHATPPTNVADSADVASSVTRVLERRGRIDLVFSNAGVLHAGFVETMAEETFDEVIAVNLRGAFLVAKHTIPALRAAGGGAIVFTGSTSALVGSPGQGAYCASKAGIMLLARTLAAELAADNIRVNCVCPGWVDTPFNDPVWAQLGGQARAAPALLGDVPLRRQAAPAEVVPAMLFLASAEACYITGEVLTVDGGLLAVR